MGEGDADKRTSGDTLSGKLSLSSIKLNSYTSAHFRDEHEKPLQILSLYTLSDFILFLQLKLSSYQLNG